MMKNDVFDVLSDDALLDRVEELAKKERRVTFNVIMHLGEVERRRIYLREGDATMFDYCTGRLGYSESAAYRRIKSYRCIRDFPQVAGLLERGTLTVSTVAMLARVINRENSEMLLEACSGKSQREVGRIVAGYQGGKPIRERIRAVVVERPVAPLVMSAAVTEVAEVSGSAQLAAVAGTATDTARSTDRTGPAESVTELGQIHLRSGGDFDPTSSGEGRRDDSPTTTENAGAHETSANGGSSHAGSPPSTERETYYEFTIAADEEFMEMYRRVRCILSTRANPGEDIAAAFKAMMREYIARHAPEEKQKRREKRARWAGSKNKPEAKVRAKPAEVRTRHIPDKAKDQVRVRDRHRCAYVARDGVRCGATRHLQFDHVVPFAKGGGHEPENLRLVCAAHNRSEAIGVFGVAAAHRERRRPPSRA